MEGAKKLWDYLDRNSIKLDYFFQTDSSELLTAQKVERLLKGLKFLSESQVMWLVRTLAPTSDVINPRHLESEMTKLKASSTRSAEMQRALLRLRKYIQEQLRISLMQAFAQAGKRGTEVEREELREGLVRLAPHFPVTEIGMILNALYAEQSKVTADVWVQVLCSAAQPEERKTLSRPPAPTKPILLAADTMDNRYTPMTTFTRPVTAPQFQVRSRLSTHAQESDCVSATNWSESSSTKEPEELPLLVSCAPGEKLVGAGRLLTNTAELGETRLILKEMRSLGTHAYSGPGRHHEVLGEIEAGGVVTVLETNGVWGRVQCGKYEGWVPLCKLDEEVNRRLYSRHDLRFHSLENMQVSILSQVYVRKEPNWSSQALTKLEARSLPAVGVTKDWVKVECEGGLRGWVPRQFTSLRSQSEDPQIETHQSIHSINQSIDLFREYDKQNQSYFSSSIIGQASLNTLKSVVKEKMRDLGEQHKMGIRERLERMAFRKRMVRNWLNLDLSQGFHQWRKQALATSKYDKYLQEKTQAMRTRHLQQLRSLANTRSAVRLHASATASSLRLSLKAQESSLHLQRQEQLSYLQTRAKQEKMNRTQSIEKARMSVQMRNSSSASLLRQSLRVS